MHLLGFDPSTFPRIAGERDPISPQTLRSLVGIRASSHSLLMKDGGSSPPGGALRPFVKRLSYDGLQMVDFFFFPKKKNQKKKKKKWLNQVNGTKKNLLRRKS